MLDLQARVHLEEVELAVRRDDELDRAGVPVVDAARRRDRGLRHPLPQLVAVARRRRLLDDLLVPPLDRAVALEEVDDVAARVAEDLELDVPRLLDVALEEQAIVAERLHRLAPRRLDLRLQFAGGADDLHPLPAAARARLHEQRKADRAPPRRSTCRRSDPRRRSRERPGRRGAASGGATRAFEPIAAIESAFGPMKMMPASSHAAASSARSERKP